MDYTVVEKEVEYIPEFDGNAERDESERIVFVLQYLTVGQRSKCYRVVFDRRAEPQLETDNELLVKYGVKEIRGLSYGGEAITTPEQLIASRGPFDGLLTETAGKLFLMNRRADSGN